MVKRCFKEIREEILNSLLGKKNTINRISKITNINWRTVENHLTYLVGRGLIEEVLSTDYVRVFDITEQGRKFMKLTNGEYIEKKLKEVRRKWSGS